MNMVGTCQSDRTGACEAAKEEKKGMKEGTYESVLFQHKDKPLTYTMWADNNIMKTLSNFHAPGILPVGRGLKRRRRVEGIREEEQTEVSCPTQHKAYS